MAYLGTLDDTLLKQSSILELGSGCGAVGMYAALRGQKGGGDIGKPVCLICLPCHALILWKFDLQVAQKEASFPAYQTSPFFLAGARPVVLSDVKEALPLLKRNVVANHLNSCCSTCALPAPKMFLDEFTGSEM